MSSSGDCQSSTGSLYSVALASFIFMLGLGASLLVLPLVIREVGGGDLSVSAVYSAWGLSYLLFNAPMGFLADRVGARKTASFALIVNAVVGLAYYLSQSPEAYMVLRFAQGVAEAVVWSSLYGYVASSFEERRLEALGTLSGSLSLGFSLGPAVGSALMYHVGRRALFLLFALSSLASSAIVYLLVEASGGASSHSYSHGLARALKSLDTPSLLALAFAYTVGAWESSLQSFYTSLLQAYGLPEEFGGHVLSAYYTSMLAGQYSLRLISGLVKRREFPPLSFLIVLLMLVLTLNTRPQPYLLLAPWAALGFVTGVNTARVQSFLAGKIKRLPSTAMGLVNAAWGLGYTLGSPIYALALERGPGFPCWVVLVTTVYLATTASYVYLEKERGVVT